MTKRYIAFLRGINISGKNRIPMSDLKSRLTELGFHDVATYLNSGNIVFSADCDDAETRIHEMISEHFSLDIPVYVIEADALSEILGNAPDWWDSGDAGRYDNLIFILSSDSPEQIRNEIGPVSETLEMIEIFGNVIFWTFDRKQYQKCNWWKRTAKAGIAEKLTIRTASTVKKVCR